MTPGFGAKTAYEASIALVNAPADAAVLHDRHAFARSLRTICTLTPTPARAEELGAGRTNRGSRCACTHGGMAGAGGAAAGLRASLTICVFWMLGWRRAPAHTATFSSLRYDSTFRPIADAVLTVRGPIELAI